MELSYNKIHDLLIGDDWTGDTITDYAHEYGEPGYELRGSTPLFLIGDWWCRCGKHPRTGQPARSSYWGDQSKLVEPDDLHDVMSHHPRFWRQLEDQGVEWAFDDEWIVDHEGGAKAYRTHADSYSWQSSIMWSDDGLLTPDDDIERWIENISEPGEHPSGVLPSNVWSEADILAAGFERWPDDETDYESGWHPGQDADPKVIADAIWEEHPGVRVVFSHVEQSQFYSVFAAYWRDDDAEEAVA